MKTIIALLLLLPALLVGQNAKKSRIDSNRSSLLSINVNPLPSGRSTGLPISTDLHIFHHAKTALPGQPLFLEGAFPANSVVNVALNDGVYAPLAIGNQQLNSINTAIPETFPIGIYAISVASGGRKSQTVYINRAEGYYFSSPDVYAGAPMELVGTNLLIPGFKPTIRFISQSGGKSLYATFVPAKSFDKRLNFIAPKGLILGVSYNVYVSNGMGGTVGETLVDDQLKAVASGRDVWTIGSAWGRAYAPFFTNIYNVKTDPRLRLKAAGDGVVNDQPAIQSAINLAAASPNGGVVYLPGGSTYKIIIAPGDGNRVGIYLRSKVVLVGDGPGLTTITFGHSGTKGIDLFRRDANATTSGVANLSISNKDVTGSGWYTGVFRGSEMFWKNVKFDMLKADFAAFWHCNKVAVVGCEFNQTLNSLIHGPLSMDGSTYVIAKNNKFTFCAGPGIDKTRKVIWEANTLIKDVGLGRINNQTYHIMTVDFVQKALIHDNSFLMQNGAVPAFAPFWKNDLETLIAEDPDAVDQDQGSVSSATPTTLTDITKKWGSTFAMSPTVAIISGKGMGQTRDIASRTATTLTLSQAWSVTPDVTSKYAIFNWTIKDVSITANRLHNMQRGFTFYFVAGKNVNIENNTLINSGAIDLNPSQFQRTGFIQFSPIYDFRVAGNYCNSLTDPRNGTFIGVHTGQNMAGAALGPLAINTQIIGNMVIAGIPNLTVQIDDFYPNGFLNYHFPPSAGYVTGASAALGTSFYGNTGLNLDNGFSTNSGTDQMSLKANNFFNTTNKQNDNLRSIGTSVRTSTLN
ncbi:glycosyl hydrolase family 28-related protein [Spirosoma flavum]|uniref:Glycosyl hydrolase family 28-related protein n=1 Tax=Spirosoma flavum TaxID=2048557 RepID=A0ABW6ANS8_9BACT